MQEFSIFTKLGCSAGWFKPSLVPNPNDRFSRNKSHFMPGNSIDDLLSLNTVALEQSYRNVQPCPGSEVIQLYSCSIQLSLKF